jgi:hypothetical protein
MDKNGGNPWEIPSFNEESDECTMGTSWWMSVASGFFNEIQHLL